MSERNGSDKGMAEFIVNRLSSALAAADALTAAPLAAPSTPAGDGLREALEFQLAAIRAALPANDPYVKGFEDGLNRALKLAASQPRNEDGLDEIARLRQQNHEHAEKRDRELADLNSRVAKYERSQAEARERVRNWPVDWTTDPPERQRPEARPETSTRQAEQARLVEEARRHAGVAEALDLYGRLQERTVVVRTQEPDGWWRYSSENHRREVAALIEQVRASQGRRGSRGRRGTWVSG